MTTTIQRGLIGYNDSQFADYAPLGGVHTYTNLDTGMVTLEGCFTCVTTSWPIAPNTGLQPGGLLDSKAFPKSGATHSGPAAVRIGSKWYAGTAFVKGDGTFWILSDASGNIAECSFTITYPGVLATVVDAQWPPAPTGQPAPVPTDQPPIAH